MNIKEYVEKKISKGDIRLLERVTLTTHDEEIWFGYTIKKDRKGIPYEDGNYGYIFFNDKKYGWHFIAFSFGDLNWKKYILDKTAMNYINIESNGGR